MTYKEKTPSGLFNPKQVLIAAFIFCFSVNAFSQDVLTLKEALRIGLENNFDIKIAKNDALLAKESNTFGNAGYLPNASISAGTGFQVNDISQKFASGLEVNRGGVLTRQANASLAANWLFFDGGKMFITKKKQDTQQSAAEIRVQNQVINFSDSLAAAYYQLVLSKLDIQINQQDIERTEERLKIASEQLRVGTRPKSDQILAQIDLNVLKNKLANQKHQIEIRKGGFNQLLGRDPEIEFEVVESEESPQKKDYAQLKAKVIGQNLQLKYQQKNLEVSKLSIKEVKSRALPQIGLNAAYNYGQTNNQAGFALFNRSLGPNVGINITVPLFSGISINKLVSLANLDLETRNLQLKLTENRLLSQLWRSLKNLDIQLESMEFEKQNISLATENNEIVKGRFRLGQATSLELKDAENQLSNAQSRMLQAKFNAKIFENQILRLAGELNLQ
jgi:outer membrane protein